MRNLGSLVTKTYEWKEKKNKIWHWTEKAWYFLRPQKPEKKRGGNGKLEGLHISRVKTAGKSVTL